MSKKLISYRCPQCGKLHDYPIEEGVDISKEPQFRSKVMDASIFDFVCPHCGSVNGVLYPFLYHDPSHRFMVQLVDSTVKGDPFTDLFNTDTEQDQAVKGVIEDMKSRYRFRTVTEPNELMEKISIFENELDDRILELIKLGIMTADDSEGILGLWFSPSQQGSVFMVEEETGFHRVIPIDMDLYHKMEDEYDFHHEAKDTRIDEAWAKAYFNRKAS